MNLALSDEQEFLREAARGALSRVKTIEAAREALEGGALPDLWPTVVEAGWPGLLVDEEHGGAGLGAFDAMLVAQECGRVLAGAPLLGLLPGQRDCCRPPATTSLEAVAAGERAPGVAARAPARRPRRGLDRRRAHAASIARRAPRATVDGDGVSFSGEVAVGARRARAPTCSSSSASTRTARPVAGAVEAERARASRRVTRYDATRSLGHVTLDGAAGRRLRGQRRAARARVVPGPGAARRRVARGRSRRRWRWRCSTPRSASRSAAPSAPTRRSSTASPRSCAARRTPARCCTTRAGPSRTGPRSSPLAASAARSAAGSALDFAARQNIVTHGGIGATWEHDAPLFFRRAQLSRRLLGGAGDATDRVAAELLAAA